MSTRCIINFTEGPLVVAKVYRHHDGYPDSTDGVLADLQKFFEAVEHDTTDTRFNDPSYLAAKFVVWQANKNTNSAKRLDFTGVGIVVENPGDIHYEYFVDCDLHLGNGRPTVTYETV